MGTARALLPRVSRPRCARLARRLRLDSARGSPSSRGLIETRVHSISDPHEVADPAYPQGLKDALAAAVDHRLAVLEDGERRAPAVPAALLTQARLDARDGVALDTVLRRYFAGNSLFGDFLAEEAERAGIPNSTLRRLLGEQATLGDRLLAAVSAEYEREAQSRPTSAAERRRECVKSLLAGELVDCSELGYDLDGHHLGLMAKGEGADELIRGLASTLGRRLLIVQREEEPKWACWLGGTRPLEAEQATRALADGVPENVFVTVGEPAKGLAGWRVTHQQAKAALPAAEYKSRSVVQYRDVAILAAVLRDDLLLSALRKTYLEPLEQMRDGGKVARDTPRAYMAADLNVSSTAAALGVDRHTVRNRLSAIEELLEDPINGSLMNLDIALRLED